MSYKEPSFKPFKIEIERNTNVAESEYAPFFITVNGKRYEGVKRFCIDLDREKIMEHDNGNPDCVHSHPWTYLMEFEDFPDD